MSKCDGIHHGGGAGSISTKRYQQCHDQIIAKVLMSFPSSLKLSFAVAWDSAPTAEQTPNLLTTRLVRLEKSIKQQSEKERGGASNVAFLSNKNACPATEEQAFPAQGH
jgi:hypothetical protein